MNYGHKIYFVATLVFTLPACSLQKAENKVDPTPTPVLVIQKQESTADSAPKPPSATVQEKKSIRKPVLLKDGDPATAGGTAIVAQFTDAEVNAIALSESDCTPIDLSPDMIGVKFQRNNGDCFAYTATELMNYKNKKTVSALATAIQYGTTQDPSGLAGLQSSSNPNDSVDGLNGGTIADAMKAAQGVGLCYEKDVPSRDGDSDSLTLLNSALSAYNQKKLTGSREHRHQKRRSLQTSTLWASVVFPGIMDRDYRDSTVVNPTSDSSANRKVRQAAADVLYNAQIKTALDTSETFELYLRNLLKLACYRTVPKSPLWAGAIQDVVVDSTRTLSQAYHYSHQTLQQKYPIGMGYNIGGIIYATGGGHASVISGRQWRTGTSDHSAGCYLLVKNSWGASASPKRTRSIVKKSSPS